MKPRRNYNKEALSLSLALSLKVFGLMSRPIS